MPTATKGAAVYLSATDIEALHNAQDHLSTLLESAGSSPPELSHALAGVYAILHKVSQARRTRDRSKIVAKALKAAASE